LGAQAVMPFTKPVVPPKLRKDLTKNDRLLLMAYSRTNTLVETAKLYCEMRNSPYYASDTTAAATVCKQLRSIREKVEAKGAPEEFWEMMGLGANRVARAISEGMDATMVKPMVVRTARVVEYENAQGQPRQRVVEDEAIVDAGPYIDHQTRVKSAETAARLRGDMKRGESMTVTAGAQGDGFRFFFVMEQK
jgi:hypothetical protein